MKNRCALNSKQAEKLQQMFKYEASSCLKDKDLSCSRCEASFGSKQSLQRHMKKIHLDENMNEKPTKRVCNFTFEIFFHSFTPYLSLKRMKSKKFDHPLYNFLQYPLTF